MSPRNNTFLSLCLTQAELSPLHYRHGCIIVRGGKVIGQGYNDYRPGFNGGALKTGRLPAPSLDDPAMAELKKKQRPKRGPKNEREFKSNPQEATTKTFTPFESMGAKTGGKYAHTPLSMHSEMMAIHSAISASSTLASTAVSSQKPYFKLSGDSKRKARLQREAIKIYVEIVCKAALTQSAADQRSGPSRVQSWRFKRATSEPGHTGSPVSPQQEGVRGCGLAQEANYGETPNEESPQKSSQQAGSARFWTSQTTAPAICT